MSRYKFSDADFITAVNSSISIRDALKKLGLAPHGGSYKIFQLRIKKLNIDVSHFTGQGHLRGKTHTWGKKVSLSDLLVGNSVVALSIKHKQRIIDAGLLNNLCAKCGLKDNWCNEPIVLHLDHINGDHFDHRIENLRLLCPNCHSQTDTYCAKNKKINNQKIRESNFIPQEKNKCSLCERILKGRKSLHCKNCYILHRRTLQTPFKRTKIDWPTMEELKFKLETISFSALGRELGVSDNAIRKHIKGKLL